MCQRVRVRARIRLRASVGVVLGVRLVMSGVSGVAGVWCCVVCGGVGWCLVDLEVYSLKDGHSCCPKPNVR